MLDTKLRQIISSRGDDFKPYDRYGEPIPGMSWVALSGELQNGRPPAVIDCS